MMGMSVMAAAPPSPRRVSDPAVSDPAVSDPAVSDPARDATLRSNCFLNRSRAIWSIPKVAYSLRTMS